MVGAGAEVPGRGFLDAVRRPFRFGTEIWPARKILMLLFLRAVESNGATLKEPEKRDNHGWRGLRCRSFPCCRWSRDEWLLQALCVPARAFRTRRLPRTHGPRVSSFRGTGRHAHLVPSRRGFSASRFLRTGPAPPIFGATVHARWDACGLLGDVRPRRGGKICGATSNGGMTPILTRSNRRRVDSSSLAPMGQGWVSEPKWRSVLRIMGRD